MSYGECLGMSDNSGEGDEGDELSLEEGMHCNVIVILYSILLYYSTVLLLYCI